MAVIVLLIYIIIYCKLNIYLRFSIIYIVISKMRIKLLEYIFSDKNIITFNMLTIYFLLKDLTDLFNKLYIYMKINWRKLFMLVKCYKFKLIRFILKLDKNSSKILDNYHNQFLNSVDYYILNKNLKNEILSFESSIIYYKNRFNELNIIIKLIVLTFFSIFFIYVPYVKSIINYIYLFLTKVWWSAILTLFSTYILNYIKYSIKHYILKRISTFFIKYDSMNDVYSKFFVYNLKKYHLYVVYTSTILLIIIYTSFNIYLNIALWFTMLGFLSIYFGLMLFIYNVYLVKEKSITRNILIVISLIMIVFAIICFKSAIKYYKLNKLHEQYKVAMARGNPQVGGPTDNNGGSNPTGSGSNPSSGDPSGSGGNPPGSNPVGSSEAGPSNTRKRKRKGGKTQGEKKFKIDSPRRHVVITKEDGTSTKIYIPGEGETLYVHHEDVMKDYKTQQEYREFVASKLDENDIIVKARNFLIRAAKKRKKELKAKKKAARQNRAAKSKNTTVSSKAVPSKIRQTLANKVLIRNAQKARDNAIQPTNTAVSTEAGPSNTGINRESVAQTTGSTNTVDSGASIDRNIPQTYYNIQAKPTDSTDRTGVFSAIQERNDQALMDAGVEVTEERDGNRTIITETFANGRTNKNYRYYKGKPYYLITRIDENGKKMGRWMWGKQDDVVVNMANEIRGDQPVDTTGSTEAGPSNTGLNRESVAQTTGSTNLFNFQTRNIFANKSSFVRQTLVERVFRNANKARGNGSATQLIDLTNTVRPQNTGRGSTVVKDIANIISSHNASLNRGSAAQPIDLTNTASRQANLVSRNPGSGNTAPSQFNLPTMNPSLGNTAPGQFNLPSMNPGVGNTAPGQFNLPSINPGLGNLPSGQFNLPPMNPGLGNLPSGQFNLPPINPGLGNLPSGQFNLPPMNPGSGNTAPGQFNLPSRNPGSGNTAPGQFNLPSIGEFLRKK